jgi:flagellar basal-body rod protein FlgB
MAVKLFDKNTALFEKSVELRSRKNSMIASNIANRETPGYRAQDLVFEKELTQAYHSDRPGPLKVADPRHFDGVKRDPVETVQGTQINSFNPDPRMDGNTVNLDTEMTKLAENQLMYEISIRFLTRKFNGIKNAIMEGGR